MIAVSSPGAARVGVALLIPLVTLLLQWLLWDFVSPDAWAMSYPAVFLASFIGGRVGGLGATALATLIVIYVFVPPENSFVIDNPGQMIPAFIFVAVGLTCSAMQERLRKSFLQRDEALSSARQMNLLLEERVHEKTAELEVSNESLRTSGLHLQTVVENLGEGVVLADKDGKILFMNQAALAIVGMRSVTEYQRMLPEFAILFELTLLDGTLVPLDQWPLARVLRGEKVNELDACLTHVTKGWRKYISLRCSRVDNIGSHALMGVLVMADITDRRRRETRYEALIEHSSDSVALINADNLIIYLSPAVTAVEGYLPEEMVGSSGLEHTHPEDVPFVHEAMGRLLENPGKAFPVLWRRRHKQGHWVWLEGVATNLAHLALLDQITRAIAEHQDLESVLNVMIRSLEEGLPIDFGCVLFLEPGKQVLRVASVGGRSQALAQTLQMAEQDEIAIDDGGLAQCISGKLVYESELGRIDAPFPQRLRQGGLNSVVMVPLRAEQGVMGLLITARTRVEGFSSSDCEFLRQLSEHIALAINQSQLYSALQQAYDELHLTQAAIMQEERLRVLGQMASGIAHDINNALTPMLLYTELLLESEQALSQRGRNHLEIIRRSVHDVSQTVVRLRDFARPHDMTSPMRRVRINPVIKQVIDLAQVRWHDMALQRGSVIKVVTSLKSDLPEIQGVESEIREALTNLIINAVDAMPDGGALTLRTRLAEASQPPRVLVEVSDNGIGMDDQTRQRCLEPFFTTKGAQGTGLGLAMVFGMAKRHAATFDIDSAPGKGTTMRLGFLVAASSMLASEQATAVVKPPKLKLLLIDDDPILLNSLSEVLLSDGHEIVTASSGREGLAVFKDELNFGTAFDAVITDLGMPYMDGRQLAGWVKQASPHTPVLLLTGWGQRLIEEGDIPSHIDRVLAKPPMLPLLRSALVQLCGGAKSDTAS
jgi:PAS domain S-box-containing protein